MTIIDSELKILHQEAVSLLSDFIRIPSYSKEEAQVVDFFQDYLIRAGLSPIRIENNIVILPKKLDPLLPTILLNSHIDTVKPVASWKTNPHEARQSDGKLYGLGSNDAGASVVSLLMVFKYFLNKKSAFNLVYSATAEEEISGQHGVVKIFNTIGKIDLAIVGEPTGMNMAIAEKGLMVIDGLSKGVSGHAAREEGVNAIYKAIHDIEKIKSFDFDRVSDLLGKTKATVTVIQAGNQHNVVPDECKYVLDIRSNEKYSNEEIHQLLQAQVESTLTPRSYRLNSSSINISHPIVQKGITMGLEYYGSPTLSDQALMPFTSIKIGPGQSARSHTAEEYIEIDEIQDGIKKYIDLLSDLKL